MRKRRGRKEGCIFKRKDLRWEGRIDLGFRNGRRYRKSFFGYSQEEVRLKMAEATRARDTGMPVLSGTDTVASYLTAWLEGVRSTVRARTWESYELYVRRHALPVLGHVRFNSLRPGHIRSLLDRKLKEGLSAQSCCHLRTVLNTALKQAVADRLLAWNPVSSVKRPKVKGRDYQLFTPGQARMFLDAAENTRLGAMFAVGLACGLRRGEVMGLRWRDVDLETQTLKVEQTIQRVRAKVAGAAGFVVADPKTDRSRRTLVLPAMLIPVLKRWRARQAEERLAAEQWGGGGWGDMNLVFANRVGGPVDPHMMQDEFKATLKAAGLLDMRLHDLRHCSATFLIAAGAPLRLVMETLGHSTIKLTADTYGHIARELLTDAAVKMDAVLSGNRVE